MHSLSHGAIRGALNVPLDFGAGELPVKKITLRPTQKIAGIPRHVASKEDIFTQTVLAVNGASYMSICKRPLLFEAKEVTTGPLFSRCYGPHDPIFGAKCGGVSRHRFCK
ncbi:hypothetical protein ACLB2K_048687 [Fragaria x ananassa]